MFSGWGVRSVADTELRYNPMSYHNGSVWPHDNSLLAAGAARYDDKAFALRILNAQFEAACHFDLMRLPELFCGFRRKGREAPLQFPVACSPQSCSAGATFLLLQSVLGISIDALDRQIVLSHPVVPEGFDEISVQQPDRRGCVGGFHGEAALRECERECGEERRESGSGDPELRGPGAIRASPLCSACQRPPTTVYGAVPRR